MRCVAGTANVVFLVSFAILVVLVGCGSKDASLVLPVDTPEGATYVAFEVHRNSLAVTDADYTDRIFTHVGLIEGALIAVGLDGRGLIYPHDIFATPVILQSAANFRSICCEENILVCGDREDGVAVVRAYLGEEWTNITHSASGNLTAVSHLHICSDEGEILYLNLPSTALELTFQAPAGVRFNDIQCTSSLEMTEVIAVGDDGAIFHRHESGGFVDESVPEGPDFIAVTGLKSYTEFTEALAASSNEIWRLRDGIWSREYYNPGVTLNSVQYLLNGAALAVGNEGAILRSDGVDWTVESLGEDVDLTASAKHPHFEATGRLDLCGSKGEVFYSEGGAWHDLHHHASGPWSAFHTSSAGTRYAANGNKLMRFEQADWVEEAVWEWGEDLVAIHVVDPEQIWALGEMGGGFDHYILFYNGSDWSMIRQSSLDDFSAIWCDAAGDNVFVTADHGQIFWLHDGNWEMAVALVTSDAFHALAGPDMESLLAVGDSGLIMRRGPSGWSDDSHGTTHALRAISGPLVAGDGGTILRQANGKWQAVGLDFDGRFNGVWYGADDNIWAVGDDEGVMCYDGTEWTRLLTHLPGIDFLAVTGAEANQVWIGGSEGYLLRSPE